MIISAGYQNVHTTAEMRQEDESTAYHWNVMAGKYISIHYPLQILETVGSASVNLIKERFTRKEF